MPPTAAWRVLMRAGEVEREEEGRYRPATTGNARTWIIRDFVFVCPNSHVIHGFEIHVVVGFGFDVVDDDIDSFGGFFFD